MVMSVVFLHNTDIMIETFVIHELLRMIVGSSVRHTHPLCMLCPYFVVCLSAAIEASTQ